MFVVCGEALLDIFAQDEPHKLRFDAHVGGSPLNVAIGLARLEVEVGFLAALSKDFLGQKLRDALTREGVSPEHLATKDAPTTLAFVSVEDGGGASYAFYGNGAADRALVPEDLPELGPDVAGLHAGSYSLVADPTGSTLLALFKRERRRRLLSLDPNVRFAVEPNRDLWRRRVAEFAECADVIKISWEDVEALYPEATAEALAAKWLSTGPRLVVFTLGADGAIAFTARQRVQVPGHTVGAVVDTVGAGDTLQAALIAGLRDENYDLERLTHDRLTRILNFATRAAAITCSRHGADLPRRAELFPQP